MHKADFGLDQPLGLLEEALVVGAKGVGNDVFRASTDRSFRTTLLALALAHDRQKSFSAVSV
jgi:hypothetical protein